MMEIHGTIHFKLILPHFPGFQQEPLSEPVCSRSPECDGCPYPRPGFQQEPLPEPVCSRSPECKDCPYPRHGFLCWGADGTCLRSRMNEINEKKEDNDHDERSFE